MSNIKTHKFLVEDAKRFGVQKAILLEHLKFHQEANQDKEEYIFDGKSHSFIGPTTVENMYPYFSKSSVRRWLRELEDEGVISSIKPEPKVNGGHLKYYHVHYSDQNDRTFGQNDRKCGQNGCSHILPSEEPCVCKDTHNFDSKREPDKESFHQYCKNELKYSDGFIEELYKHCKGQGYFKKWDNWRLMVSKKKPQEWNKDFNDSNQEGKFDPEYARRRAKATPG